MTIVEQPPAMVAPAHIDVFAYTRDQKGNHRRRISKAEMAREKSSNDIVAKSRLVSAEHTENQRSIGRESSRSGRETKNAIHMLNESSEGTHGNSLGLLQELGYEGDTNDTSSIVRGIKNVLSSDEGIQAFSGKITGLNSGEKEKLADLKADACDSVGLGVLQNVVSEEEMMREVRDASEKLYHEIKDKGTDETQIQEKIDEITFRLNNKLKEHGNGNDLNTLALNSGLMLVATSVLAKASKEKHGITRKLILAMTAFGLPLSACSAPAAPTVPDSSENPAVQPQPAPEQPAAPAQANPEIPAPATAVATEVVEQSADVLNMGSSGEGVLVCSNPAPWGSKEKVPEDLKSDVGLVVARLAQTGVRRIIIPGETVMDQADIRSKAETNFGGSLPAELVSCDRNDPNLNSSAQGTAFVGVFAGKREAGGGQTVEIFTDAVITERNNGTYTLSGTVMQITESGGSVILEHVAGQNDNGGHADVMVVGGKGSIVRVNDSGVDAVLNPDYVVGRDDPRLQWLDKDEVAAMQSPDQSNNINIPGYVVNSENKEVTFNGMTVGTLTEDGKVKLTPDLIVSPDQLTAEMTNAGTDNLSVVKNESGAITYFFLKETHEWVTPIELNLNIPDNPLEGLPERNLSDYTSGRLSTSIHLWEKDHPRDLVNLWKRRPLDGCDHVLCIQAVKVDPGTIYLNFIISVGQPGRTQEQQDADIKLAQEYRNTTPNQDPRRVTDVGRVMMPDGQVHVIVSSDVVWDYQTGKSLVVHGDFRSKQLTSITPENKEKIMKVWRNGLTLLASGEDRPGWAILPGVAGNYMGALPPASFSKEGYPESNVFKIVDTDDKTIFELEKAIITSMD